MPVCAFYFNVSLFSNLSNPQPLPYPPLYNLRTLAPRCTTHNPLPLPQCPRLAPNPPSVTQTPPRPHPLLSVPPIMQPRSLLPEKEKEALHSIAARCGTTRAGGR